MALVNGTCHHDCPDTCGWIATVEDGVATQLRGDPEHPYSQGELCPKVNRFVERVYHSDRILHPLIRSGAKGAGEFRQASWDEALGLIATRFHDILANDGGEAIVPWWDAGTQGLLQESSLDKRLFARLGATRRSGSICGETAAWGTFATYGSAKASDPSDVRHADLIVLWATNTLLTNRHLWPFIEEARSRGARVVVIDPIRTITAERADTFIQPQPGTDVAMMLAIMQVLIEEDLIDRDYIDAHTFGFDQLASHVASWTPDRAAEITGVPAPDIRALAVDLGTTSRSFIRTLIGAEHAENGAMFFRTLSCIPLLTGSFKHLGGGFARSVGAWTEDVIAPGAFRADHLLPDGELPRSYNMSRLGEVLTDPSLAPPAKALVVWNGNPAVTVPNAGLIRQGLARDDLFTVVSEQFMTDTATWADVVLPATTQLEQTDVVPSWGHLYLGWNEPAIEPQGEAVPNTELWRRLARALGFDEPELYDDDQTLLAQALPDVDLADLRARNHIRLPIPEEILPYANGGFGFPDGRAQFVSEMLEQQGHGALPDWKPPTKAIESSGDYPLRLLTPKSHVRFLNTSYSLHAGHADREGGPWVELHQNDADARGITAGDNVRVKNQRGELVAAARIGSRTSPGVVLVPFGWSRNDFVSGGSANDLTSDELSDWGGGVAYNDTQVEVELAH